MNFVNIHNKKLENISLYLISHNVDKEQFLEFIKNIYEDTINDDKVILMLGEELYDLLIYNNITFDDKVHKNRYLILNNKINNNLTIKFLDFFKEYNDKFPEKSMLINEEDFIKNYMRKIDRELINNEFIITIATKLIFTLEIINAKEGLKYRDTFQELKEINPKIANSLFIGYLWEQLNQVNSLLPKGFKRIIKNNEWKSYIKDLFPENNNYYKEFDLHIIDEQGKNYFIELKNYYQDNEDEILYFRKYLVKDKLLNNIQFSNDTKSKVYYYLHNTKTNTELLIPIKDLYNLLEKNGFNLNFYELIDYVKKTNPENLKEKKEIKKFASNEEEFFKDTINVFQKNIKEKELLVKLNTTTLDEFCKEYDNLILKDISSKDELKKLFFDKNLDYIGKDKKDIVEIQFNNFIQDDLDFENKEMVELCFNNLKNALNSIFELEDRSKISLDKTNIEKYYRSKKVIDTMNSHGYSMNIIFDNSYEKFLTSLLKELDQNKLLKIVKNKSSDYYRRIKPYLKNVKSKTTDIDI